MDNPKGKQIIESWVNSGHLIANHTYNHFYYNSDKVSIGEYKSDILRCDTFIKGYKNYIRYFRAPYLKRGNTVEKRDELIKFLEKHNYKNGYVTVDASDWYYDSVLIEYIRSNPDKSIDKIKEAYVTHLLDRASYYDDLSSRVLGRKVKHCILLHHNLASALFLGDLIEAFKKDGWDVIDAKEALKDEVYSRKIKGLPAGESIIWSIAKETGKYDKELRYPAEDSRYEKEKVRKLGLK